MASLKIIADRIFDGERFRAQPLEIVTEGSLISRIEPVSPSGALREPFLDARGMTVLPGLVNAHVHIARGGMFGPFEPFSPRQVARNLKATLASGVTTVGDMGCAAGLILAIRDYLRSHAAEGPSIRAAGPLVTSPGGYPLDWLPWLYRKLGVAIGCASEKEGRRVVSILAAKGVDHIKIAIMHESYAGRPIPRLRESVARAMVAEAHALGLRVFAHAHTVSDYKVALQAGVDALMHSSFEPLNREMLSRLAGSSAVVCPTLWVFESLCLGAEARWDGALRYTRHVSRAIRREWRAFCDAYEASGDVMPPGIAGGLPKSQLREAVRVAAANLRLLTESGIPVVFGNDAAYGFSAHARPVDEILAMHRAGMGTVECLRAATSHAAALLGCKDRGMLRAGKRADLLVVRGDLEVDLTSLERVHSVIAAGRKVNGTFDGERRVRLQISAALLKGLARDNFIGLRKIFRRRRPRGPRT